MAGGRGTVFAEVAGRKRRLRANLGAIDEIEARVGVGFPKLAVSLEDEEEIRLGWIYVMFEEMCRAGGSPLSNDELADLLPSDIPDMLDGIRKAARASGVIEDVDEDEGAGKKKGGTTDPTSSPGDPGSG